MQTLTFTEFKKKYDVNFKAKEGDIDFIGRGGFGAVYLGHNLKRHEKVAIKRSPTDKNLLDEVERAEKIPEHANIARYLDGFRVDAESGDFDIAILQYYPKGNLNTLISEIKLSEKQLDDILKGILEGLKFLHEGFITSEGKFERIIHRDLKPQNILIAEYKGKFTPLITDFGISKLVREEDNLSSGKVQNTTGAGTVVYKAPEQIQNGIVKNNLDLWAFGVMLFKICTRKLPFNSTAPVDSESFALEVMKKITGEDLDEVFEKIAKQPLKYQKIIKRCLVRDINDRVQHESELIDLIDEIDVKTEEAQTAELSQNYTKAKSIYEELLLLRPLSHEFIENLIFCTNKLDKQEKAKPEIIEQLELKTDTLQPVEIEFEKTDVKIEDIIEKRVDDSELQTFWNKYQKEIIKISIAAFLIISAVMYLKTSLPEVRKAAYEENSITVDETPLMVNKAKADSLFKQAAAELSRGIDKNVVFEQVKEAVLLNNELKPKAYELFHNKAIKLRAAPELSTKYDELANEFK